MLRRHLVVAVTGMALVVGCGGGTKPMPKTARSTVDSKQADMAAAETELEEVPPQSEPGDPDFPRGSEAFARLVAAAQSNDAKAWAEAESQLQELGAKATAALTEKLEDENTVARELAAMFLAQIGPDAVSAAKGLTKLLQDDSTFARVNAAAALSTFEGYEDQVAPVLTALLVDSDENVRLTAATSLRNIGAAASKAVMPLTKSLKDPNPQIRAAAATTLGELGSVAFASLPALRQLRSDSEGDVVTAATQAIRRIDESSKNTIGVATPASATE